MLENGWLKTIPNLFSLDSIEELKLDYVDENTGEIPSSRFDCLSSVTLICTRFSKIWLKSIIAPYSPYFKISLGQSFIETPFRDDFTIVWKPTSFQSWFSSLPSRALYDSTRNNYWRFILKFHKWKCSVVDLCFLVRNRSFVIQDEEGEPGVLLEFCLFKIIFPCSLSPVPQFLKITISPI